jgi:hypothetical protein
VTPAARAKYSGPQPHVVDGGYYDNYGMATLVEWLDEALTKARENKQSLDRQILVIQIHGAPLDETDLRERRFAKNRGWFYQALAPLLTLFAVRTAGQVAHNDIELELLKEKWGCEGVSIESALFEFTNAEAPLSWHLTPTEKDRIRRDWDEKMKPGKDFDKVRKFL